MQRLLTIQLALAFPAALAAQNVFHGNGIPSAYVENTPGVLGQQLTVGFGSPTAVLPIAILGLSDGVGPVFVPGPHLGNIGLDLFSPVFQSLTFGLDGFGNGSATLLLPPGYPLASDPPLFMVAATLEATAFSISKTVRIEWANPDGWEPVAMLGSPRQLHTATALGSGPRDQRTEVLICGGATGSIILPTPMASAELYSPLFRATTPLPSMSVPRSGHRSVRLHDGRVLVTGGVTTSSLVTATCEFFDPVAQTFVPAPAMTAPRVGHALTLLDDGRVFASGGVSDWQNAVPNLQSLLTAQNTAELFDPVANAWTALPVMASKRFGHTQTKLPDGRVLLVSGIDGLTFFVNPITNQPGYAPTYARSCDLFDPATLTFTATAMLDLGGNPKPPRGFHGASLLPNGDVLVTGGLVTEATISAIQGAAIPTTKCCVWSGSTWSVAAPLPVAVAFHTHEPHDGGALVFGGFTGDLTTLQTSAQVVRHDGVSTSGLAPIGTDGSGTPQPRGTHTCTRLYDGTFLVYGGGLWPNTLVDGWVYTPN